MFVPHTQSHRSRRLKCSKNYERISIFIVLHIQSYMYLHGSAQRMHKYPHILLYCGPYAQLGNGIGYVGGVLLVGGWLTASGTGRK